MRETPRFKIEEHCQENGPVSRASKGWAAGITRVGFILFTVFHLHRAVIFFKFEFFLIHSFLFKGQGFRG